MTGGRASGTLERSETHRQELLGYCYRFFGSYAEAEDAVQETMVRAWRGADAFQERSSLRTWLFRIATNVCLDMRKAPQRRALPTDLAGPGEVPGGQPDLDTAPADTWIGPIGDIHLGLPAEDPAERAAIRDSVRLAFLTALQQLPPRQRVVLLLRDVLDWSAKDCADLLDATVASVNSALARARRTLAVHDQVESPRAEEPEEQALLQQYVDAFEHYDVDAMVALLAHDARFTMPPFTLWLRGSRDIDQWWRGPGQVCRNSRLLVGAANGLPTVAVYHPVTASRWDPFAVHVLTMDNGLIESITHFMGAEVFAELGLPDAIEETSSATDQS